MRKRAVLTLILVLLDELVPVVKVIAFISIYIYI